MHGNQCAAGTARKPVRTAADNGADHSTDSANRGAERRRHADNDENKKNDQQQYISERNADPVFKEADSGFSGGEEEAVRPARRCGQLGSGDGPGAGQQRRGV